MAAQTAVVLGASGLIGGHVLQYLLGDLSFDKVRPLTRKPLSITHPKLENLVTDFSDENDFKSKIGEGDVIFCCVGTTQKKVKGDKDAYRKVDYDIPVNAARLGVDAGFSKYALVSAVGANASSGNFYLKLKGKVEEAITNLSYKSIKIFQPSILLGDRKEFRLGEAISKKAMTALSFMFAGGLKKYKPIHSRDVAKAMLNSAKSDSEGIEIYQYGDMMKLATL